jgi:HlyD family secretion protein
MKTLRIILVILLVSAVAVVVYWYLTTQNTTTASSSLSGSGTVEATEVIISPEVSGRLVEILVGEGDLVKAGDTLFKLDDTLLNAQRAQAETNLASAQAGLEAANTALAAAQAAVTTAQTQYDLTLANARLQAQPALSNAWIDSEPSEFDQPIWYFTHAEEITATQKEVSAAEDALAATNENLNVLMSSGSYTNLADVENRLAQAQSAFLNARQVLDQAQSQDNPALLDVAQEAFDSANAELDAAQQAYDELLTTQEAENILDARARLAASQRRYDNALDRYNALLTGEDSLAVKAAADAVAQAQANATSAQSRVTQAQKAIDQAQAAINLIDIQLEKLVITSPMDGVVLARSIEPGEVVMAGASTLTIGELSQLTITVYIPENLYGGIKLGDSARVSVDSFPNQTFDATVTRIADQAEFTPRNVQTSEGRQTTVFAVKLAVQDPAGLLKPGMPADVAFDQK